MVTFENGLDIRCREVAKPTVARFHMSNGEYRYIVIGTQYGYIHTSGGDIHTWKTPSGAYKFIRGYNPF